MGLKKDIRKVTPNIDASINTIHMVCGSIPYNMPNNTWFLSLVILFFAICFPVICFPAFTRLVFFLSYVLYLLYLSAVLITCVLSASAFTIYAFAAAAHCSFTFFVFFHVNHQTQQTQAFINTFPIKNREFIVQKHKILVLDRL